MHTTDSIDYVMVVSGEVTLDLDDGEQTVLRAGDVVIQNGTRHAWRNHGTEFGLPAAQGPRVGDWNVPQRGDVQAAVGAPRQARHRHEEGRRMVRGQSAAEAVDHDRVRTGAEYDVRHDVARTLVEHGVGHDRVRVQHVADILGPLRAAPPSALPGS
jgi:hypothetical protein